MELITHVIVLITAVIELIIALMRIISKARSSKSLKKNRP